LQYFSITPYGLKFALLEVNKLRLKYNGGVTNFCTDYLHNPNFIKQLNYLKDVDIILFEQYFGKLTLLLTHSELIFLQQQLLLY
jgi:hypothetical protein